MTNLADDDIRTISDGYLNSALGETSLLQLVAQKSAEANQQLIPTLFFDGSFSLQADARVRTMRGRYLRIISFFEHEEHESFFLNNIEKAANLLRLRFGLGAAAERAETIRWDLRGEDPSRSTTPSLVRYHGDGREGNSYYLNGITANIRSQTENVLRDDASRLATVALESNDLDHSFLFLWMALEAQIGDGKNRTRFCQDDLGSPSVSEEMKRLHGLRSGLAHGERGLRVSFDDFHKLLELFRMACLPKSSARQDLAKIFEITLSKP